MNIAIIGCGYVGSAAARHWKQRHHVTALTRSAMRIPELKSIADDVKIIQDNWAEALAGCQAVLLCMAPEQPDHYESAFLQTAQAVLQALPHTPELKQIIYTGSASVYGDHDGRLVDENTPCLPQHRNARILIETEQTLLQAEALGYHVCVFRLGEIYGPGRKIADRLRRMAGRPLPGNGVGATNLIHLDDIVGAIDFALQRRLSGIYNLCNDLHIPRKHLYEQICNAEGLEPIIWNPELPSQHAGNKTLSNAKLKAAGHQNYNQQLY